MSSVAHDAHGQATATGKPHFEVLDGLRGSAALLVVLYHIQSNGPWGDRGLVLPHAYLAVDFFFTLSGFVIGYAYDDRWARMSIRGFVRARLARLHPLIVLGALFGLASYALDPFAPDAQVAPLPTLAVAFALALFALPGPPLGNRGIETHPLNGPSWTLLQEYAGNIAYALILRRLPVRALGLIAAISGVALLVCATAIGTLDRGWGWSNAWMAPVRLCYPFVTGLLLHRVRDRLPRWQGTFLMLTLLLVAAFALPTLPAIGAVRINGVYEAACVLFLFPAIVVAGAHSVTGRGMERLCRLSGRISYPIYVTHFPIVYAWKNYVAVAPLWPALVVASGAGLLPAMILVALAGARLWDQPIRERLRPALR